MTAEKSRHMYVLYSTENTGKKPLRMYISTVSNKYMNSSHLSHYKKQNLLQLEGLFFRILYSVFCILYIRFSPVFIGGTIRLRRTHMLSLYTFINKPSVLGGGGVHRFIY
jgi:hypothetical protein